MIAAVLLGGCAAPKPSDEAQAKPEAAAPAGSVPARARQAVAEGALLLDVRTPQEFADGHLPGAVNIPVDELRARLAEVGAKDRPVVLYCRSGRRSATAARMLEVAGWTAPLIDLGPMTAWESP